MRRIMSFLDPNCLADYFDSCYQPLHGVWGLAGGGIFGLGPRQLAREVRLAAGRRERLHLRDRRRGARPHRLRRHPRPVRAVRRRRVPRHPQDRRPVRAHRLGRHHGLDRRPGAHQHRRRAARLPGARRAAAVHVAGRHVAAVGARRVRRAARVRAVAAGEAVPRRACARRRAAAATRAPTGVGAASAVGESPAREAQRRERRRDTGR